MSDCFDNLPTGVAQEPYDTNDTPFLRASRYRCIVADLRLELTRRQPTAWPLRIHSLYNFGLVPAGPTVFARGVVIHDADGELVYDSDTADTYVETPWGSRFVCSWVGETGTLQIVRYADTAGDFLALESPSTQEGELQPRSTIVRSSGVQSITVGATTIRGISGFIAGHNMRIESDADTGRISFHCEAGEGAGIYRPCPAPENRPFTTINNIPPTDDGRFFIQFGDCLLPELVTNDSATPLYGGATTAAQAASAIRVHDFCSVCCSCEDYLNVYKAVRRLQVRLQTLANAAVGVRDLHAANSQRWTDGANCRNNESLIFAIDQPGACQLGFRAAYRNSSNVCLTPVELRFTLLDWLGTPPATPASGILYYGDAEQPTPVGGSFPTYFAIVPALRPGQSTGFRFLLSLPGCTSGTSVTVACTVHTPSGIATLGTGMGSVYPYVARQDQTVNL